MTDKEIAQNNFNFYLENREELMLKYSRKTLLIHDGGLISVHDTYKEADDKGEGLYGKGYNYLAWFLIDPSADNYHGRSVDERAKMMDFMRPVFINLSVCITSAVQNIYSNSNPGEITEDQKKCLRILHEDLDILTGQLFYINFGTSLKALSLHYNRTDLDVQDQVLESDCNIGKVPYGSHLWE